MTATLTPLSVGDTAPDFVLRNQHGEEIAFADLRAAKNTLLVFVPFAFSGICTGELSEIRDSLGDFQGEDIQVLAISCDPMYSLSLIHICHGGSFHRDTGCSREGEPILSQDVRQVTSGSWG